MSTLFPYYNYYSYNNKNFSTKLNALIAARKELYDYNVNLNSTAFKWHLPNFEKEMDKIDLFVEPKESLSDLYRQRAEQLRNQYPYLILFYSGGSDSHNILETFMYNNIFLDEIVIMNWYDYETKKRWQSEDPIHLFFTMERFEPEYAALPLAKHFVEKYSPKTKINYIDNVFQKNKNFFESLNEKSNDDNLKSHIQNIFDYRNILRYRDSHLLDSRFGKLNSAHIYGLCKPNINKDDKGYYIEYRDDKINGRCDPHFQVNSNFTNELFYLHPSTCKMQVKQAHLLLKNKVTDVDVPRTKDGENMMANVLYNRKIELPYSGIKFLDMFHNELYSKYYVGYLENRVYSKINPTTAELTMIQQLYRNNDCLAIKNIDNLEKTVYSSFFSSHNISSSTMIKWIVKTILTKKFYIKWN